MLTGAGAACLLLPHAGLPTVRLDQPGRVATEDGPSRGNALALALPVRPAATGALSSSAPVRVQIPALGVTSAVMELGLEDDGTMEVPPDAYPVGWYAGGPSPGQVGPAVLAGHVDWGGQRGAFYGLRDLLPGDRVDVGRADGTVVTFSVDRIEEHPKSDFPTEAVYGDLGSAALRLITCGGGFDEDTGDYEDNVIVFASLLGPG